MLSHLFNKCIFLLYIYVFHVGFNNFQIVFVKYFAHLLVPFSWKAYKISHIQLQGWHYNCGFYLALRVVSQNLMFNFILNFYFVVKFKIKYYT